MTPRTLLVACLAIGAGAGVLAAGPPAQAPPAPQDGRQAPAFRSGVDVVSLNVTVSDPSGRYLTELEQGHFSVYEDGIKQELNFFNRTRLPIALSLLLDTSASMDSKLATAQEAAVGFVRRLRPQDIAQVIDFDSKVQILQGFTGSAADLEQAIRRTSAGGSTSLFNAVYISLKELRKVVARENSEIRRQAIVLLSDGEDTSSLLPFEEVLDLAKRSETGMYAIGLMANESGSTGSKGFKEAEFVLRQLAQQTGGRVFFPTQVSDLPGIYGQIADELSSQYTLGYVSRNSRRDGSWRRVVVRVDREGAIPRTKQGYFAPTTH